MSAWLLGVAATRIVHNELVSTRRAHARDRAAQAQAYNELEKQRLVEQRSFTKAMKRQVDGHISTIGRLTVSLRLAEQRAKVSEKQNQQDKVALGKASNEMSALRARIAELETANAELRAIRARLKRGRDPSKRPDFEQLAELEAQAELEAAGLDIQTELRAPGPGGIKVEPAPPATATTESAEPAARAEPAVRTEPAARAEPAERSEPEPETRPETEKPAQPVGVLDDLDDVPTVVDLLRWDERASEPKEQRKHA
ncbi:MAG: hypothetical protein GEU93_08480 [Propionibacteriales bacterium]|nr:hypothetical protein [Propionibacteriales bacterium]